MGSHPPGHAELSAALFGKTRRAVLGLLLARPDERFYLRQIVRAVRCGQGGVQREVRRLVSAGIILRMGRDRIAFYQANVVCPVFGELRGLVLKTAGAGDVLPEAGPSREARSIAPGAPVRRASRPVIRAPSRRPGESSRDWTERMPPELL